MRTMKAHELVDLLEAVNQCKSRLRRLTREGDNLARMQELERLGIMYSLLPIDQLLERVIESSTYMRGAA